jgi:hypothetical protein
MARLAIEKLVLRDLGIRSKNKCAFPRCDHPVLNEKGEYVAELCHIEAAEQGGERHNPSQTDDERRAYGNLLFLCHAHHVATNDVTAFPVEKLRAMKEQHEALPDVVFDHALLLVKLEEVLTEQSRISAFVAQQNGMGLRPAAFPINTCWVRDSWTPEEGRFYESPKTAGSRLKLMTRDGWLHIEQTLQDGATAYYEVNESGEVRSYRFPYPMKEYRVEIPESIVLRRESAVPSMGNRAVRTVLKWSTGSVVEHYQDQDLVNINCDTRFVVDHVNRLIRVLPPPHA